MTGLPITSLYAGVLGCTLFVLSYAVIKRRGALKLAFGDGGDKVLMQRIRAQANFSEYVPLGVLLLGLLELGHAVPAVAVHVLGASLLMGRVFHAYGFLAGGEQHLLVWRVRGMGLTLITLAGASCLCVLHGVGVLGGVPAAAA